MHAEYFIVTKKNAIFFKLALVACIFILFSCESKTNRQFLIGFLLPNLTDARYLKDREFFTEKIRQLGGIVEFNDANNDANIQFNQAQEMIRNGVKILVITPVNQIIAASIVRMAHENKIKVIAYERLILNCDLDYLVNFNHFIVGKQQASYALEHKPEGNYVILGGDKTDKNAELINKGQNEIINKNVESGKIRIVYSIYIEDWNPEIAYLEMKKALNLSNSKVDVVLVANDGMASGVIKALDEIQPGYPVIVTGLDADLLACKRIIHGQQSMTVYKPFKKQAEITAQLAMDILLGSSIKYSNSTFNGKINVPTINLESIVVNAANIKSVIVEGGFYTNDQISQ